MVNPIIMTGIVFNVFMTVFVIVAFPDERALTTNEEANESNTNETDAEPPAAAGVATTLVGTPGTGLINTKPDVLDTLLKLSVMVNL